MAFHDTRFPTSLSFGSLGGPERRTQIVTLANGYEERNTPWAHSRRRYDAGLGLRSLDDVQVLLAFFEARRGQLHAFRWKDWADFKSSSASRAPGHLDQPIGVGDGVAREFRLTKTYDAGAHAYERTIVKPVAGTVTLGLDGAKLQAGVQFELDAGRGLVTFEVAPSVGARLTAGYEFDVPVRFDTDLIQVSVATFNAGELPNVPIVEVRL